MKETRKHLDAFMRYCAMEDRNLRQLAADIHASTHTVGVWSSEFDWQARVEQYDKDVAEALRNSLVENWAVLKRHLLDTLIDQLEDAKKTHVRPTTTRDVVAVIREIRSMVGDVVEDGGKHEGIEYVRTITNEETSDSNQSI